MIDEELFEASLCIESDKWTKDTLSGLPACKGVLLFAGASGQPIQLLQAAHLRRTAQAKLIHDELTSASRRTDVSEMTAKLFYQSCDNQFESQLTYLRLAHAVFDKTAGDWIQLPKISLAVIEMDAYPPYFYVSDNPQTEENRRVFGLFANRKAVAEFCDILNTVFGLCRNPSLLKSGKEASCPYLQMETCPGPCLDASDRERYSDAVRRACATAAGHIQPAIQALHEQMNQAAKSMQFEQAALFKKQFENLRKLTTADYCWVHDLQDLCVLHIDLGSKRRIAGKNKKRQQYKAWKITTETIYELGAFVPKAPKQMVSFLDHTWTKGRKTTYTNSPKEHLAVLSLFLFRSTHSGLWLDCTNGIPKDRLHSGLHEIFELDFQKENASK